MAEANVETLLTIPDAQLHEVAHGKESLKEWGPLNVTIHSFQGESGLWLQIGKTEWSVDGNTPTLEAAQNTYMFALTDGRFLSLLLHRETPVEEARTLQEILIECTSFEHAGAVDKQGKEQLIAEVAESVESDADIPLAGTSQPAAPPTTAERITSGAATASEKLMQSANWASRKILEQSQAYMDKHEATQNPVNVSPAFAKRVKMARKAAEMTNRAANRVAGGIADVTIKISDTIIHHMGPKHYGEQLQDPNKRPNAAKEIASAAVLAATGVYDSMEQASRLVLKSSGQASSDFVGHKYGQAAGEVAKDAASGTITAGMTYMTTSKVGLRKIARKVAKRTATGLAKNAVLGPKPPAGAQQGQLGQQAATGSQSGYPPVQQQQQQQGQLPQAGYGKPTQTGYNQSAGGYKQ